MHAAPILSDDTRRLSRLRSLGLLDTEAEAVLDGFTQLAASVTGMPIALISLVDQDRQWFKSAVGLPQGAQTGRDVSFCGHAITQEGVFEVSDATQDPRFFDNPLTTGAPHVVHYAGVPLTMPGGERIGTICLINHQPGRLPEPHREFLVQLARNIVNVLMLRESEHHLRHNEQLTHAESLSEFSPVGMFTADATGAVVHANGRWLGLLGEVDLVDAIGWGWLRAVHPDDVLTLRDNLQAAAAQRRSVNQVFRTHPAQPAMRWLRLRLQPADRSVSAAAFVGAVMDITEKKNLEHELRDRNRLLEAVIEHLPCGLAVYDQDLRHVVSNQRLRRLQDLPDHLLQSPGAGLETLLTYNALRGEYGPGDPDELARARLDMARTGQPMQMECTRPNGLHLEIRTGIMPNGWQVHVCNDVTEQRTIASQLMESQDRLDLALQATDLGLFEYAPLDDVLYLSDSWGEKFGWPAQDNYMRIAQLTDLATPDMVETFRRALVDLLKGVTPRMCVEHQMINAAGDSTWVQTEAQVTERNEAGRAVRVVGTTKDISDRKRHEAQLREAVDRADAASRAKADFLATMSHEIRTPINGVIGLARMLEDAQLPARESSWVTMINSCANTLLGLVNDVLDFSKIEAGQMTLDPMETDLHALLRESGDVFAARAQEKDVGFSVRIDPAMPQWVMADSHRLRQILLNLLGNALKFTSRGTFSLHATVEPLAQPKTLRFDITDSGIGISPEGMERLFKRYSQAETSTSRKYHGTGLGLAICRDLARLMGGEVTVASTVGVGSTFTVTLPLVAVASRQAAAPAGAAAPRAASQAQILLVEDNAINQLVARALLTRLGYRHVTVAEDGRQAVAKCAERAFDLVLMDCQMPVMDGFEATRALRDAGLRMPIIALTAGAVAQDRERCLAAGMDDFLCKPIDGGLLAQALEQWLTPAPPLEAPAEGLSQQAVLN